MVIPTIPTISRVPPFLDIILETSEGGSPVRWGPSPELELYLLLFFKRRIFHVFQVGYTFQLSKGRSRINQVGY